MQGTIRTYNEKNKQEIYQKVRHIVESTVEVFNCKAELIFKELYPAVINHKTEVEHVKRIGEKYLGVDKVKEEDLPLTASEDFSYFIQEKPGCFWMFGT